MPRIRLAYWHAGHTPGDEVVVSDDDLRDLQRDGRVSEVLEEAQTDAPAAPATEPAQPDSTVESSAEDQPAQPSGESSGRKRR